MTNGPVTEADPELPEGNIESKIAQALVGWGHRPVLPPIIADPVPRLGEEVLALFRSAYIPDVSDAVGPLYTMDAGIRPLYRPARRMVGQALTAKAVPGDNLTIHGALGMVRDGDVLVVDWRGTDACGSGAGSLIAPKGRGLAGIVIDGGWRDVREIDGLGIPLFGRTVSPYSPPKNRQGEINVPVSCGGVVVHAGDVVIADEEGVVVVPRAAAGLVAAGLKPYSLPQTPEEWQADAREAQAPKRAALYRWAARARGASIPD